MNQEHIKGAAEKMKGAVKEAAGNLIDDKSLQAEGELDKAKASAHEMAGDVRDAVKDAQKNSRDAVVDVADDDEL